MMIQRITEHLRQQRRASLHDMALSLKASPDALRGMLAVLEKKGRVRRVPAGTACAGGCAACKPETIELYDWVEHH
jgi:DeoR/GlpR family transcriptional regulator of sugar metabolism